MTDRANALARDDQANSGATWDYYVKRWRASELPGPRQRWPGDEWEDHEVAVDLWDVLFAGVSDWKHAIEIGSGSGKYAEKVLARSSSTIRAYDVSREFLDVCALRCADEISKGRLSLQLLEGASPSEMLDDIESVGLRRKVDAVFSIDAMVHVELQYLVVYLMVSALALRAGGRLILTLADATSTKGFDKMLRDVRWTYAEQGLRHRMTRFAWLSPDLVRFILTKLGFEVETFGGGCRDLWVVATLTDLTPGPELERHLRSTEPRTWCHRV